MTNLLFLASQTKGEGDKQSLALKLRVDMKRLSALAKRLLEVPKQAEDRCEKGIAFDQSRRTRPVFVRPV